MRTHYKSDWHKHNLHLKLKSLDPISESQFLTSTHPQSTVNTDSESNPDSHDSSDAETGKNEHSTLSLDQVHTKGSPFVKLLLPLTTKAGFNQVSIYKQSLASLSINDELAQSVQFWSDRILKLQMDKPVGEMYWTLLMLGSGHFAGAVIDLKTGKSIVQKTFHRYTTRRKQGGAQSSNDGSKGNAHSAGAGIRRYNEAALQTEVRDLLIQWKPHIKASQALFIRATGANRSTIYFDKNLVDITDPRVRSFPFTTMRPTQSEIMRCFVELSTVRIDHVNEMPSVDTDFTPSLSTTTEKQKNRKKDESVPPVVPDPPPPQHMLKLSDFCKRGKSNLLQTYLDQHYASNSSEIINCNLPDKYGVSLLHIASENGNANVVELLLGMGADPTIKGMNKKVRAYDVAKDKPTRDAFRRFMARNMEKWDYKDAHIFEPLTAEMEERQAERERNREQQRLVQLSLEKEKEEKEQQIKEEAQQAKLKQKSAKMGSGTNVDGSKRVGIVKLSHQELNVNSMTPEQRMRLDREKRALAAEARMKSSANKCSACGKSLVGITPFEKLNFKYCSTECIQNIQLSKMFEMIET
ncbi:hypothetical protein BATDEDRAFT_86433 [Batrachochytrium dendrobatidis JAM81]|uniref:VLRF1 domain-containing protein n=1 Tax=Batrachochytrium dendrobatidis (strain JAM81 / FGSC 10211) TaxID=684364 RepID=F4NWA3_BATDJ|nr:uncharacterized protein BATDEDRAFT_86433 [Batrachochytrium dendrobatidis JAM81]EGF82795.1 hypothetical protein BATDEDRAFT_86433 [Batrachochytrium dendrobatidis JAM81]|eukprot:XP_006677057.1 hypothetical protein BATDEDRAFT_86433 [Batrachochytrium dendrobatidis JAM81]